MAASAKASTSAGTVQLTLTYRTESETVALDPSTTLIDDLRHIIYGRFHVHASRQKLLPKPKFLRPLPPHNSDGTSPAVTLADVGLRGGTRHTILILGPQDDELQRMQAREEEKRKREAPRNYHPSMLRGGKQLRNTSKQSSTSSPFGSIQVHPATPPDAPEHSKVHAYLTRLASDPAIVHVCSLHSYTVGILTELLPHEHPELLGLNENSGQRISLRVRTDRYDGLRDYHTSRRVLLHELAHNDVHDHNAEFKTLNSLLNAQVLEFEEAHRRVDQSGRSINGSDFDMANAGAWEASNEPTSSSTTSALNPHVLGGSSKRTVFSSETPEQRRSRILQALEARLEPLEAEIRKGCRDTEGANGNGANVH